MGGLFESYHLFFDCSDAGFYVILICLFIVWCWYNDLSTDNDLCYMYFVKSVFPFKKLGHYPSFQPYGARAFMLSDFNVIKLWESTNQG